MKTSPAAGLLTIGVIAQQTGCNVPTIRYYEQIGLIPPAKRRSSRHRVYDDKARELLTFIRRCRDFGFPIEQIRALISLAESEERDCVEMRDIAQTQLGVVRAKLLELHALERSLERFVQSCTETCAGGPPSKCSILKDLQTGCCG
jgi:DNA-binding transcriptional MerR regulator